MKTRQEVFSIVKQHLLTQNARSMNEDGLPMYRGLEGRKCAVGVLISDEIYSVDLETRGVLSTEVGKALRYSDVYEYTTLQFLYELQHIHDGYAVEFWAKELDNLAIREGLIS